MEIFSQTVWAADKVKATVETGVMHAIFSASLLVQLTLLTLVVMSVISWAIIFSKRKQIQNLLVADDMFSDFFAKAKSLDEIFANVNQHNDSGLARVFRAGYQEMKRMADSHMIKDGDKPLLTGHDNLERALRKAIDNEVSGLETRLGFLATTGSTGPFIGLFGTVWGIMTAFQKIGQTGMASLAVVAPGISEALIATAIGLAAAIPATVAYNHFATQLKKRELELNNFASDFLNIAKRNFFTN